MISAALLVASLALPKHYHLLPFDQITSHRKACTIGTVVYKRKQEDEDWHITIINEKQKKLVAEIIPELPLVPPLKGDRVLVCGISGTDDHHKWNEIHPVVVWRKLSDGER
jgi:hypothetical protein